MNKMIVTVGIPASGKSSRAKQYYSNNKGVIRVNKDLLRQMLDFGKRSKAKERMVEDARDAIITAAMVGNKTIIVDDTNFSPRHINRLQELCVEGGYEIEIKFFDAGVETCIRRDSRREKSVGERVIRSMYEKSKNDYNFVEYDDYTYNGNDENKAIIVDIDGTLAHMNGGRGPFERHNVGQDDVDYQIKDLVDMYRSNGYKILIFTGRDGVCATESKQWLSKHFIEWDEFHIRPEGDERPDYVVKAEMFEKVRDFYNVRLVIDDRKQVVKYWRSIGMKVLHVDRGNF